MTTEIRKQKNNWC